jgi:hypothetical protein
MTNKPQVTIVAPAIRTDWWLELYEAIQSSNDTKLKFIFIGHIRPNYKLPDNFTYVYCDETPSYCTELAFRMTDTEYVMNIADDYDPRPEHMSRHIVDKCLEEHIRVTNLGVEHFFVGPSFKLGPEKEFSKAIPLLYDNNDHTSPVLTISPLTKTSTNRAIGGICSSFYGMYWDTDINMRLYNMGGHSKVMGLKLNDESEKWEEDPSSNEYIYFTERNVHEARQKMTDLQTNTISLRNGGSDHRTFRSLWNPINFSGITLKDGRHYFEINKCNTRKSPFVPFSKMEELK